MTNQYSVDEAESSLSGKARRSTPYRTPSTDTSPHGTPQTKRLKCEECHLIFSKQSRLERHRLTHSAVRPECCVLCNRSFKRKEHLKRHLISVHSDFLDKRRDEHGVVTVGGLTIVLTSHNCDICTKTFNTKDHLNRHKKIHAKHQVQQMSKNSRSQSNVLGYWAQRLIATARHQDLKHYSSYPENRQYESFAPQYEPTTKALVNRFNTMNQMPLHLMNHNNGFNARMPIYCVNPEDYNNNAYFVNNMYDNNYYGQSFQQDRNFFEYFNNGEGDPKNRNPKKSDGFMMVDKNTYPNDFVDDESSKCPVCSGVFFSQGELQRHIETAHSNEALHKCSECGASFTRKGNLTKHFNAVHKNNNHCYLCLRCHQPFPTNELANQHMVTCGEGEKPITT